MQLGVDIVGGGVSSRSPVSYVCTVKTAIYSLTLSPLNFSNEIINYSIVLPPGRGGRGGIEAPGPLLGKLNSSTWEILIISREKSSEKILL